MHTKYCNTIPSYFKRWYITNDEIITKSSPNFPNICRLKPTNSKGTKIVFSCTWYENKKKLRLMFKKTKRVSFCLWGDKIPTTTEGRLPINDKRAQKNTSVPLENLDYHFKNTSVKHQKLGTFSWYSPRCTGKIACKGYRISEGF